MALSNIFREPRREITEQVIGVIAVAIFLWGDYVFASWMPHDGHVWPPIWAGMLLWPLCLAIGLVGLSGLHLVGEGVCALMARAGFDPRPKRRY